MKKKSFHFLAVCFFVAGTVTAQQEPPKPPTPEQKLQHVTERIDKAMTLTDAQKKVIREAYQSFFQSEETLRKKEGKPKMPPPPPPPPADKAAMDKLVQQRDAKIKSVLNADTYKKYLELERSMRPPRPGAAPDQQSKQ
jgi:hypothetical protein